MKNSFLTPMNISQIKGFQLKLLCSFFFLTMFQYTTPHGTVTSPPSRIWNCFQEGPENPSSPACIAAVSSHGSQPLYDWNEINQASANGNHTALIMDGNLASGGRPDKYGGMDQVRSDWVATAVSPGPFTVTWTNSAPHNTSYYEVYITKEDWTPDQPLTWDSLSLLARTSQSSAEATVDIPITLPQRTGKHVIYSIWQRSDSPEAFYSTSDIEYGILSVGDYNDRLEGSAFLQNYPNPFSTKSSIQYKLKKNSSVTLKVYDILGKEISTLVNEHQEAGEYKLTFNRENLNSGVYFYVLKAGDIHVTKRMVIE